MSGKSTWVKQLLSNAMTMISPPPARIIWLYKRWQPLYTELQKTVPAVEFVEGIPSNVKENTFLDTRFPTLIIIDDLMKNATSDEDVCDLFTEGAHHRNLSVICLLQNIFYKAKGTRTMSLNCQYLVVFKNPRDIQQFSILARQMYGANWKKFLDVYKEAVGKPYGHLLIDLKQDTPESKRLVPNVFSQQRPNDEQYKRREFGDIYHSICESEAVNMDKDKTYNYYQPPRNYYQPMGHYRSSFRPEEMYSVTQGTLDQIKTLPSCSECGVLFSTLYDLQKHVKKGCPMDVGNESLEEGDTDESDIDAEESDESGFNRFINKIFEENDDQFQEKVQQIMDKEDISENEAREEAREQMLLKDRALFLRLYKDFLKTELDLKHSHLHKEILNEIKDLLEHESLSLEKAISHVLNGKKKKFDELLQSVEETDSDQSDIEESDNDE